MQAGKDDNLTMTEFLEYKAFREKNELFKKRFHVSTKIDFGLWETKIVFDYENRLFCMDEELGKTIFEGNMVKFFTIREDASLLYQGSADGVFRYESIVPKKTMELTSQALQLITQENNSNSVQQTIHEKNTLMPRKTYMDEPFKQFNIEIHLDHPYWDVIECSKKGPVFPDSAPNVEDYLKEYQNDVRELESLVRAIKVVAFPEALESVVKRQQRQEVEPVAIVPKFDVVSEIKKYKELMDEGTITVEEFTQKKKQLMDIE